MAKTGIENDDLIINGQSSVQESVYGFIYRTADLTGIESTGWTDTEFTGGSVVKVNVTHDTGTNPERVAVDLAGKYKISYMVNGFCDNSIHTTYTRLIKNGTTELVGSGAPESTHTSYAFSISVTIIADLAANDYITLQGRTDSNTSQWKGEGNLDTPVAAQILIKRIG